MAVSQAADEAAKAQQLLAERQQVQAELQKWQEERKKYETIKHKYNQKSALLKEVRQSLHVARATALCLQAVGRLVSNKETNDQTSAYACAYFQVYV